MNSYKIFVQAMRRAQVSDDTVLRVLEARQEISIEMAVERLKMRNAGKNDSILNGTYEPPSHSIEARNRTYC